MSSTPRNFPPLERTSLDKTRVWSIWVEDDTIYTQFGNKGGKLRTNPKVCTAKYLGRPNEISAHENAVKEAERKWKAQLDLGFQITKLETIIEDELLDNNPTNPNLNNNDKPSNYKIDNDKDLIGDTVNTNPDQNPSQDYNHNHNHDQTQISSDNDDKDDNNNDDDDDDIPLSQRLKKAIEKNKKRKLDEAITAVRNKIRTSKPAIDKKKVKVDVNVDADADFDASDDNTGANNKIDSDLSCSLPPAKSIESISEIEYPIYIYPKLSDTIFITQEVKYERKWFGLFFDKLGLTKNIVLQAFESSVDLNKHLVQNQINSEETESDNDDDDNNVNNEDVEQSTGESIKKFIYIYDFQTNILGWGWDMRRKMLESAFNSTAQHPMIRLLPIYRAFDEAELKMAEDYWFDTEFDPAIKSVYLRDKFSTNDPNKKLNGEYFCITKTFRQDYFILDVDLVENKTKKKNVNVGNVTNDIVNNNKLKWTLKTQDGKKFNILQSADELTPPLAILLLEQGLNQLYEEVYGKFMQLEFKEFTLTNKPKQAIIKGII